MVCAGAWRNSYAHANTNIHAHAHADTDGNCDPNCYRDSDSNSNTNSYSHADAYTNIIYALLHPATGYTAIRVYILANAYWCSLGTDSN